MDNWFDDPVACARTKGKSEGVCPMRFIDERASNHWDVFEICSWFKCDECVAEPEDFGWCENSESQSFVIDDERGWEIPF